MQFRYQAKTKQGERRKGMVVASTRKEALRKLKRRGLLVTGLAETKEKKRYYIGGIKPEDKIAFTKNLAVMLRAGISISEAVEILILQSKDRTKRTLTAIHRAILGGDTLADSLAAHPRLFDPFYINMVHAGEESGSLPEALERLGDRLSKDVELKKKARSALIYPAIVLFLTIGLGGLVATFVLPRLSSLFRAFKFELPLSTRILLATAEFVDRYGYLMVLVFIVSIIALFFFMRNRVTAPLFHRLWTKIPVVKDVSRNINLSRIALVLGSLMENGLPIDDALRITSRVLTNARYRSGLDKALAAIDRGDSLASALERDPLYPKLVTRMIAVGEKSGKLEDVLAYLGIFYEDELDDLLKNLSTFIEPALILVIGAVVALVALAIVTPIYGFLGAVQ